MIAQVGPLSFVLRGSTLATVAPFEPQPLSLFDEETLSRVTDGPNTYLLLDHRRDRSAGVPAFVEFWTPEVEGEVPLAGLFALGDCAQPHETSEPVTLGRLAVQLRATG